MDIAESVGAAAPLHPCNADRATGSQGRGCLADQPEVGHAIKLLVVCHSGRAVAEADLGSNIDVDLNATIGRCATKRFAFAPLVDRKRPLSLRPNGTARCFHLAVSKV